MLFKNDIVVINRSSKIDTVCKCCGYLARDKEDLMSIKDELVCTECLINFKHAMKEEWANGERPSQKVARERMNIFMKEV